MISFYGETTKNIQTSSKNNVPDYPCFIFLHVDIE